MSQRACRESLRACAERDGFDNPGLALARYLKETGDEHGSAKELLESVAKSSAPEAYRAAFERYKAAVANHVQVSLELAAPLAVGLGTASPLEVGLATLHTFGMPVIPGSAVKGVCCDAAEALRKSGQITDDQLAAVFGNQKRAGMAVFFDAWYDPSSVEGKPFHRDVVTVHHPGYYQKHDNWPSDFDDPTPVPFIVVKPKAKFLFAVQPPNPDWADWMKNLLVHAMTTHGVGGKINAGYGWFSKPQEEQQPRSKEEPRDVWPGATVTYQPNNGQVSCTAEQGRASGQLSAIAISRELKERLMHSKKHRLDNISVEVTKRGNAWIILRIFE